MKDITERLAKVGERVRIPCPDGIKGCAVFHFRVLTDPVCLEAIVEIKRLREALREAREEIICMSRKWVECEASEEELIGFIDAVLPRAALEEKE